LSAATGDTAFDRDVALPLLVETARLWQGLGHFDAAGRFRIDGVTGPDEYSAVADNNVFTNLMAQRNLRSAAGFCRRHPDRAADHRVDQSEVAAWCAAADAIHLPFDARAGVHQQAENFTFHARLDFTALPADPYPLMLHVPYFDLYRKQVVKQADLVLAMHLCGDAFDPEQKRRNFDYYEELTVRDSSLSACTQAVLAAEVGHLGLAWDYTAEAALMDLRDLAANTANGLHLAALAGTWIALVAGFGGMRDHNGELSFAPRLPDGLDGLSFAMRWHNGLLRVAISPDRATYTWCGEGADDLVVAHHGEPLKLPPDVAVVGPIPPTVPREPPRQPPGRAPLVRHAAEDVR
jgi:alpha,alpha-trehalose phosphorylase